MDIVKRERLPVTIDALPTIRHVEQLLRERSSLSRKEVSMVLAVVKQIHQGSLINQK